MVLIEFSGSFGSGGREDQESQNKISDPIAEERLVESPVLKANLGDHTGRERGPLPSDQKVGGSSPSEGTVKIP